MSPKNLPQNIKDKQNNRDNSKAGLLSDEADLLADLEEWLDEEGLDVGDEIEIEDDGVTTLADIRKACQGDASRDNRILRITHSGNVYTVRYVGNA